MDVFLSTNTLNWRYSSQIICRLSKVIADIHLDALDINCGHYLVKKTNFEIGHASAKMDVVLRTFTLDRRFSSQTICRSSQVIAGVHLDSFDITLRHYLGRIANFETRNASAVNDVFLPNYM